MAGKFGHRVPAKQFYNSQYGKRFAVLVDEGTRRANELGHQFTGIDDWDYEDRRSLGRYAAQCPVCKHSMLIRMDEKDEPLMGMALVLECPGEPWL